MTPGPPVARTRAELALALADLRPPDGLLVLVPTMGALHGGHRALLRRATSGGRTTVVSIFVNPLQFGSSADLERYPRDLDADLAVCAEEGVALVWAPTAAEMYPQGTTSVTVSSGALGAVLEGRSRPGHFDGVLTVVLKLLQQVRPEVAVFGAKDAQQLALVRRMVADLDLGVTIEAVETVRADDGLALSSRNERLTASGRRSATALSRALLAARDTAADGVPAAAAAARAVLDGEPGVVVDYVAVVDPVTFAELGPSGSGAALAVLAAEVEGTRLIDAMPLTVGPAGGPE